VGYTVKNVDIDLSDSALELGKIIGPNLHSQSDLTRTESSFAAVMVATKVGDAMTYLMLILFSCYDGIVLAFSASMR